MRHAAATAAIVALAACAAVASSGVAAIAAEEAAATVPYPADYRNWRHVKSMLIEEGHPLFAAFGGIHHLYANEAAMTGYRTGKFPDGAVIAFDLLEAPRAGGAVTEGDRKVLGVMHRDARRYAATGGWGFEGFAKGMPGERAVGANARTACFDCHAAQAAATGYVFSRPRD